MQNELIDKVSRRIYNVLTMLMYEDEYGRICSKGRCCFSDVLAVLDDVDEEIAFAFLKALHKISVIDLSYEKDNIGYPLTIGVGSEGLNVYKLYKQMDELEMLEEI